MSTVTNDQTIPMTVSALLHPPALPSLPQVHQPVNLVCVELDRRGGQREAILALAV